jgi:hypothetical protein
MNRIGITASKIARGNVVIYNTAVVCIIFLLAFLTFVIAGTAIMAALFIVGHIISGLLPGDIHGQWSLVVIICMSSLTVVVSLFSIIALIKNVKVKFLHNHEDR